MVVAKGKEGGRELDWKFGISRCKLVWGEWINNKVLLYSTGNYIQYSMMKHNRKEYEKECIYMYNWVTLLYSRNRHNTVIQLYLNPIGYKVHLHSLEGEDSSQWIPRGGVIEDRLGDRRPQRGMGLWFGFSFLARHCCHGLSFFSGFGFSLS